MNDDGLIRIVEPEVEKVVEPEVYKRKVGVVEADIESNCIEHGIRGILEHKHIEAMISEYTEEDKQARVYGRFQHLTGLVFKTFNRRVHVVKPFLPKPADFMVIEMLDPHPRNPDAVMWVAIDPKGRKFIVDEIFEKFSSVDDMAFKIKQRGSQYRIVQRRADPSAWTPASSDRSDVTLASRLGEMGLTYMMASKQRTMGVQLIQDALFYQANEVNGVYQFTQEPMLYVFETCVRTIWEFEHWQYNEWSGKAADKKDQSEKPQDKDDHMMENLGRVLLDEPAYRIMPPSGTSNNRGSMPRLDPY
jgi:hypothetical protein